TGRPPRRAATKPVERIDLNPPGAPMRRLLLLAACLALAALGAATFRTAPARPPQLAPLARKAAAPALAPDHPLTPLRAHEIEAAVRVLNRSGKLSLG